MLFGAEDWEKADIKISFKFRNQSEGAHLETSPSIKHKTRFRSQLKIWKRALILIIRQMAFFWKTDYHNNS